MSCVKYVVDPVQPWTNQDQFLKPEAKEFSVFKGAFNS